MSDSHVWDAHYATAAGYRLWPNEELVRWVGGRKFWSILEAGCGNGANLWYLAEHAVSPVVGIDFCETALAAADRYVRQMRHRTEVRLVKRDLVDGLSAAAEYDLIVDCMTSQHLPMAGHARFYGECRRALQPGGWLWVCHLDDGTSTNGAPHVGDDWRELPLFPAAGLIALPSPEQLVGAVVAGGFDRAAIERRGRAREYPDGRVAHYTILAAEAR